MKHCKSCNTLKELNEFNKRGDGCPGVRSHCKICSSKKNSARYNAKRGPRRPVMTPEQKRAASLASYKKFNAKPERKAKQAYYEAGRRAAKLQATPKWLTQKQLEHIEFYYEAARFFSELFGQKMEVDHIMPLKGKNLRGLHVPWNLQLMVKEANRLKNNRVEGYE